MGCTYFQCKEDEINEILRCRIIGTPIRVIAKKLKRSPTTIVNVIKKQWFQGKSSTFPESDKKYIALNSKRDRKKTLPVLTAEFNMGMTELNLRNISKTTIGRALKDAKMYGRVGARKPLLRKENVAKRLKFALEHKDWTKEQWSKVLWSDESKFELFGTKRRTFVRRMPHERFKKNCVIPTVKHGGGSVMIWGAMCSKGTEQLHRIV
jgi:hypothetical protein